MLRATMATFSAGLGGANAITVLPHTLARGLPDPFARRVARNTQLVLLEESNLAKVSDPAAGSGGIETLTRELCEAAWALFQQTERAGGLFAALEQNIIQHKVAATRAAREANIAKRRDVLTGASEFPNLQERDVAVLDVKPIVLPSYGEAKYRFDPLTPMRLAAPFEALRDKSSSQISARPPISRRARPLPRASSRPAASRLSTTKALPIQPRSPRRSRHPARPSPVFAPATRPMPPMRLPPRGPFKLKVQGISIWQAAPASWKRAIAPQASAISSSQAAMRWRPCARPTSGWSEHDFGQKTRSDRWLPVRCGAFRGLCASRESRFVPLPDVSEGRGWPVHFPRRRQA
jgi:hypothetical protein